MINFALSQISFDVYDLKQILAKMTVFLLNEHFVYF